VDALVWADVREWVDARWVLARAFRLRARLRHVRAHVHRRRIAVRDSVIKDLVASRKVR